MRVDDKGFQERAIEASRWCGRLWRDRTPTYDFTPHEAAEVWFRPLQAKSILQ